MHISQINILIFNLISTTCFEPEGSSTGRRIYEGWNFNSGNYLFTTDTK